MGRNPIRLETQVQRKDSKLLEIELFPRTGSNSPMKPFPFHEAWPISIPQGTDQKAKYLGHP
jgi:hypothetical protein